MTYRIAKLPSSADVTLDWSAPPWQDVVPLRVANFMGRKPIHFPTVAAKVGDNDDAIFVIFRVDDQYVRAVADAHQGAICNDSCVEFFFTPNADTTLGYFNLEMNCGGTMLFHFQRKPRQAPSVLTPDDIDQVTVAHSQPRQVDPEIVEPTEWFVAYRVPFDLIRKRFPDDFSEPASGVRWRGNFYKCADRTSHPHWLTWAPVSRPQPDFHRPESFGILEFE